MLDWEFYCVNATTMLLWLFQCCDHGVLVGLVALGALCVLVSACVLASRLVSCCMIYAFMFLFNFIFINLPSYSYFDEVFSRTNTPGVSEVHTPSRIELPATSEILERLVLGAARPAVASLMGAQRALSLPQHLALNSNQWTELEASRRPVPHVQEAALPCRPVALDVAEAGPSPPLQSPVRRSARIRRARARSCRSGVCSS